MKRYLVDCNVLLDLVTADPVWLAWSKEQLRLASSHGEVLVNPVIYAELAPAFLTEADLEHWFAATDLQRAPLPYSSAWLSAQAFLRYRKAGGPRLSPLPDFYIGAHAQVEGLTLVTRDAARYRTYFPSVALISPN